MDSGAQGGEGCEIWVEVLPTVVCNNTESVVKALLFHVRSHKRDFVAFRVTRGHRVSTSSLETDTRHVPGEALLSL